MSTEVPIKRMKAAGNINIISHLAPNQVALVTRSDGPPDVFSSSSHLTYAKRLTEKLRLGVYGYIYLINTGRIDREGNFTLQSAANNEYKFEVSYKIYAMVNDPISFFKDCRNETDNYDPLNIFIDDLKKTLRDFGSQEHPYDCAIVQNKCNDLASELKGTDILAGFKLIDCFFEVGPSEKTRAIQELEDNISLVEKVGDKLSISSNPEHQDLYVREKERRNAANNENREIFENTVKDINNVAAGDEAVREKLLDNSGVIKNIESRLDKLEDTPKRNGSMTIKDNLINGIRSANTSNSRLDHENSERKFEDSGNNT